MAALSGGDGVGQASNGNPMASSGIPLVLALALEIRDRVRQEATSTVLESSGESQAAVYRADGMLDVPLEVAQRLAVRAGLTEPIERLHPLSFVDRHGILHLPYFGSERLARAFAAAEPELVLREIENHELKLSPRAMSREIATCTICFVTTSRHTP